MNYLDLFSGIGGFALGAYWAGFKCKNHFYSEIDLYCIALYHKRFPDSKSLGDIKNIKSEDLLKYGNEWIITGGFPCQDISIAGKGAGIDGERSGLWFEYWRLIRDLRPKFAIMENVGTLLIRGIDRVLESLSEIGYNAEWQTISAKDMGAPHERKRIWIVAYPNKEFRNNGILQKRCNKKFEKRKKEIGCNYWSKLTMESLPVAVLQEWQARNGESPLLRMDDGVSYIVDRLGGLGNAIVPQISQLLFSLILAKHGR